MQGVAIVIDRIARSTIPIMAKVLTRADAELQNLWTRSDEAEGTATAISRGGAVAKQRRNYE